MTTVRGAIVDQDLASASRRLALTNCRLFGVVKSRFWWTNFVVDSRDHCGHIAESPALTTFINRFGKVVIVGISSQSLNRRLLLARSLIGEFLSIQTNGFPVGQFELQVEMARLRLRLSKAKPKKREQRTPE